MSVKRNRSKNPMPRHLGARVYIEDPAGAAAAPVAAPAVAAPPPEPTAAPAASPAPTSAPAASPAPTPAPTAAPAAAKADEPVGAPEKYEAFTAPEGVNLSDAHVEQFATMARELNLPQDGAQKLVDMTLRAQIASEAAWKDAAKVDPEIGGDKHAEHLAVAKTALDKFGSDALKASLGTFGSHPEVIRLLYRVGQAISQDGFVPGRQGTQPKDARSMYANSQMNP
jgi:hypothetical protein